MTDYFTSTELQALVANSDLKKPLFFAKISPLQVIGPFSFEDASVTPSWVPCVVNEERYLVADCYKISLVPVVQGFAKQHYYQMDMAQLIRSGHVLILDQALTWEEQVPREPTVTWQDRFALLTTTVKSWLKLPQLNH